MLIEQLNHHLIIQMLFFLIFLKVVKLLPKFKDVSSYNSNQSQNDYFLFQLCILIYSSQDYPSFIDTLSY